MGTDEGDDEAATKVLARQEAFEEAERHGDVVALDELLTDDFLSIGDQGRIFDKDGWIGRYASFGYDLLETSEVDVRVHGGAAIVRNIQHSRATFDGLQFDLTVRAGQVWVTDADRWRLAGIQFSPLP
ncbi:MAG TPA: nuclear transport factor 2 family protein [Acidimicrobiales bacterium]|nr:nuclear transport factor 2 family protein [Acidimicrobiales bacterium]